MSLCNDEKKPYHHLSTDCQWWINMHYQLSIHMVLSVFVRRIVFAFFSFSGYTSLRPCFEFRNVYQLFLDSWSKIAICLFVSIVYFSALKCYDEKKPYHHLSTDCQWWINMHYQLSILLFAVFLWLAFLFFLPGVRGACILSYRSFHPRTSLSVT